MSLSDAHVAAAEAALGEAQRNPVLSAEQWFRVAEVHTLLAIEARLAQLANIRPDLVVSG